MAVGGTAGGDALPGKGLSLPTIDPVSLGITLGTTLIRSFFDRKRRADAFRKRIKEQSARVVIGEEPLSVVYGETWISVSPCFFGQNPEYTDGTVYTGVYPVCLGSANGAGIEGMSHISFTDRVAVRITGYSPELTARMLSHRWDGVTPDVGPVKGYRAGPERELGSNLTLLYGAALGAFAQVADPVLVDHFDEWTSAHDLSGIAYIVLDMRPEPGRMPDFPRDIRVRVRGQRVWDPRVSMDRTDASAWRWSRNPALCILDYVMSPGYGLGTSFDVDRIDVASFQRFADVCDTSIPVPTGIPAQPMTTQTLFTCDGSISTGDTFVSNLGQMLTSCRGALLWQGGKLRLHIRDGAQAALTHFALTDDNIFPGVTFSRMPAREVANKILAQYDAESGPAASLSRVPSSVEWPEPGQDNPFLPEDGGIDRTREIDLPFTRGQARHGYYRAQIIGKTLLYEDRADLTVNLTAGEEALQLEVGDLVPVTLPDRGLNRKLFWVEEMALRPDQRVDLVLREHDAEAYDYPDFVARRGQPSTDLYDPFNVAPPTGLRLLADESTSIPVDGGGNISAILARWVASVSPYIAGYEVQFRAAVEPDFSNAPGTDGDTTRGIIAPVIADETYVVRVRAVNQLGVFSDWVQSNIQVVPGQRTAIFTFRLDRDDLELKLLPQYGAAQSFKWALQAGTPDAPPRNPTAAEVRAGACTTGPDEVTVHTFTEGQPAIVRVAAIGYTDERCTDDEGPRVTAIYTYDPSQVAPFVTWSPAVPMQADPANREAFWITGRYGRENPGTNLGEIALHVRDYIRGTTPPDFTRTPAMDFAEDPLILRHEVARPAQGTPDRIIEAYASTFDGHTSEPVTIVVDSDIIPSINATLHVDPATCLAYVTVRSQDGDTGSYRLRWVVGEADADIAADPAFSDASDSQEMSGSRTVGGVNDGGAIGREFRVGPELRPGQKIAVSLFGLRTTSVSASAQGASIPRSQVREYQAVCPGDIPGPDEVRISTDHPEFAIQLADSEIDLPDLTGRGGSIQPGQLLVRNLRVSWGRNVRSLRVFWSVEAEGGGARRNLNTGFAEFAEQAATWPVNVDQSPGQRLYLLHPVWPFRTPARLTVTPYSGTNYGGDEGTPVTWDITAETLEGLRGVIAEDSDGDPLYTARIKADEQDALLANATAVGMTRIVNDGNRAQVIGPRTYVSNETPSDWRAGDLNFK